MTFLLWLYIHFHLVLRFAFIYLFSIIFLHSLLAYTQVSVEYLVIVIFCYICLYVRYLIHLISSLQDKNKKPELTVKVPLLEQKTLKLRNQIIENHIIIGKMQNISNTGKDSQAKLEELNMTKLVDNGEILTSDNEPLSKNPACSKSIEEQMSEFQKKKNNEKYLEYKGNSAKTHNKDESILSPTCIRETCISNINDNVQPP